MQLVFSDFSFLRRRVKPVSDGIITRSGRVITSFGQVITSSGRDKTRPRRVSGRSERVLGYPHCTNLKPGH